MNKKSQFIITIVSKFLLSFNHLGFLNKLGATLANRTNPDPNIEIKEKTQLEWRKTSQVRRRIKTATGTIPIYDYMTAEEEAAVEAEAMLMAGEGADVSGEAAVAIEAAAVQAGITNENLSYTFPKRSPVMNEDTS
ncbi:hypothetical protein SK128_019349 [Halocaridina rubra]|uniref:Uncharacterized protein n=1 Tax=Halocaridina rubra TaxID=373956 RepID=A0AAN8WY33_HALRR